MATTHTEVVQNDHTITETWTLGNADTGAAANVARYPWKTVHAVGTFGGATITFQGSNDGTNWVTLNDTTGIPVAVTFTATGMKQLKENPIYVRAISAGGTGTAVTVILNGSNGL